MNKTILTITGSDGTGGSGVQADVRFINSLGGTAASAITSITVQNTLGIQEFYDLPVAVVRQQIEAIVNDMQPQVVKIGLLRRKDHVEMVAGMLRAYHPRHVVYAPVLTSTKGEQLVSPVVFKAVEQLLLPLCTVVLKPSDLPVGERRHGHANQLGSAVAYYLSLGESNNEAMLHAQTYLQQLPADYAEGNGRSGELYNMFLDAVEHHYTHYADVLFYAEQLNVISAGLPVLATCAGLILLARQEGGQPRNGLCTMDIDVVRNAYGRQLGSFHTLGRVEGIDGEVPMTFIRAPYVGKVLSPNVDVLAEVDGRIVAVRQRNQIATAFHPELTDDSRLHQMLIGCAKTFCS